ncbi:MAG: hypothetical protein ACHQ53_03280 [Polyangiales bacterium]
MTQKRWSKIVLYGCALVSAAGCHASGSQGPLTNPNTFSGQNADAIRNDCTQTQTCLEMRSMKSSTSYFQTCIGMEAQTLDTMAGMQPGFLSTTNRCSVFTACEYYDCTTRHPMGYGDQQMDKIAYTCMQRAACLTERGHPVQNAPQAIDNCVGAAIGTLFNYSTQQRSDYELAWSMCGQLTSCAFADCFPY